MARARAPKQPPHSPECRPAKAPRERVSRSFLLSDRARPPLRRLNYTDGTNFRIFDCCSYRVSPRNMRHRRNLGGRAR
jgi:hypothetical protein